MSDLHGEFAESKFFQQARMDRRAADALVGLAAGLAADGVVTQSEAEFLRLWLENNLAYLEDPVINLLYRRLNDMLADGVLDDEEAAELLNMLHSFAGLSISKPLPVEHTFTAPNDLPLCDPAPELICPERSFVFTGVMAFGPRKECQRIVLDRGGEIAKGVSKKVHYLVIGSVGNEQWRHSSYGLKIMKAVELREAGVPIAIVGEEHWQRALLG
ncbi:MAG: BRCT domain-containing protein [Halothiobacillaceae bacterium]